MNKSANMGLEKHGLAPFVSVPEALSRAVTNVPGAPRLKKRPRKGASRSRCSASPRRALSNAMAVGSNGRDLRHFPACKNSHDFLFFEK